MKPSREIVELSAWAVLTVGVHGAVGILVAAGVGGNVGILVAGGVGDRLRVSGQTGLVDIDVFSKASRDC